MSSSKAKKTSTRAYNPKDPEAIGRPCRDFDQKVFEGLCQCFCTKDEIEAVLSTDQRILDNWCLRTYNQSFDTIYLEKRKGGKASLRRDQRNMAKTNPTLAIWLGKVELGQREPESGPIESSTLTELITSNDKLMQQIDKAQADKKAKQAQAQSESKDKSILSTDSIS